MRRYDLSLAEWNFVERELPPPADTGRPPRDRRQIFNGILWVVHTGAPWRDVPACYGPWQTVYHYFNLWRKDGTFEKGSTTMARSTETCGSSMAARSGPAAPPPEPGKRGPREPSDHALGRSRGGYGSKIHLVCDGRGTPVAFELTAGQVNECQVFERLLSRVRIRQARGRPRSRPHAIAAHKGYSFPHIRAWCRAHHVKAVIPRRSDQRRPRPGRPAFFDVILYRRRNGIERSVGWLKERRRIATRYEKLALNFRAVIDLAIVERYLSLEFSDGP